MPPNEFGLKFGFDVSELILPLKVLELKNGLSASELKTLKVWKQVEIDPLLDLAPQLNDYGYDLRFGFDVSELKLPPKVLELKNELSASELKTLEVLEQVEIGPLLDLAP